MKIVNKNKDILAYIKKFGPIRPSQIAIGVGISNTNLHIALLRLCDDGTVIKTGNVPRVYYQYTEELSKDRDAYIKASTYTKNRVNNSQDNIKSSGTFNEYIVEINYIYTTADGQILRGIEGFKYWCHKAKLNFESELNSYIKNIKLIEKIKKDGIISLKKTILSGKGTKIYLDKIYCSDFYNIGHFGKTKLGQLVYISKTSQNKTLVKEISNLIKTDIEHLIKKYNIKYIAFIPPTIKRNVQFLDVLENNLNINLKKIKIEKIKSKTLIPQKTLRKLEDRIENASKTISISPIQKIDGPVLLIDDATGSGATLNETAKKIKNISDVKVIGYSVVGSMKGFDVINEI